MLETRFHVNNKVFVIVLLMCVIGSAEHTAVQLHKCCPHNYELTTIDEGDAGKFFNCSAKTDNSATTDFFTHYNIRQDADHHIPKCQSASDFYSLLVYDDLVTVGANSCFDMLDGNMLALACHQQFGNYVSFNFELNKIYRMQKCCPMHQYYDPVERQCVQLLRPNSVQQLEDFMGDLSSSIFKIGAPKCSDNEALVEYRTDKHDLRIDNSSLYMLSHHNQSVTDRIFPNSFCADLVAEQSLASGKHWVVKVCQPAEVCDRIPCVRKCCGDGELYYAVNETRECRPYSKGLVPKFHDFLENDGRVPVEPKAYGVLHVLPCMKYLLTPDITPGDVYHLHSGTGYLKKVDEREPISHDNYCMDYIETGDGERLETLVCFDDEVNPTVQYTVYAAGLLFSTIFLGITLIVYLSLPMLQNLHGKTLICHVGSLFCAFSVLAAIKLSTNVQIVHCVFFGYFIYFTFLTAFTWLNVMCFDIWWTFGSTRSFGMRKSREWKRFLWYSLYAWTVPLLLLLILYFFDTYDVLPDKLKPGIGAHSCFFSDIGGLSHAIFFLGPMGLFVVCNSVFFMMTVIHCNKIKAEIYRMRDTNSNESRKKRFIADKAKLAMNIKLFIVMGISWLLEVIATIFDYPPELWYASDAFNCLQGLLIFVIFVCKRKVLNAFKKRLGMTVTPARGTTAVTGTTLLSSPGTKIRSDPLAARYGPLLKKSSSASLGSAIMLNVKR